MGNLAKEILPVTIEDELKQSYLDYAMSVIVGRALPDVRDGLKPVHRRVLYAMHELKNDWNKPYKKSARVVGDVIGKYHPNGDTAVYDALVRMAQPFSLRYILIDGQGNFGSVDGDSPAAMRYTEVRMSKLAHILLQDLDKETVDFIPNYDETEFAPSVLPACIPNLLINGSSGIAVGMATNIPPHNLGETIDACVALIDNANLTVDDFMDIIPGPDFPTAGIINGRAGIVSAYRTGRGRIHMRARMEVETVEETGKQSIIVTELPYQVNKAKLLEKIAMLVKYKRIEGISALRDESDKDGMRIVIELRRGETPEVVMNNLYALTAMQSVFGINMVALQDGQPKLLNLKQVLEAFIDHRQEVVTRRSQFELRKARNQAHILEGLAIALANIDAVIALIKASQNPMVAKEKLLTEMWQAGIVADLLKQTDTDICRPVHLSTDYGFSEQGYRLSPEQARAILELRLHRLTGLEKDKIIQQYQEILNYIRYLLAILASDERLMDVIKEELLQVKHQFGDERRTQITADSQQHLNIEDLIEEENMVVTLSHAGYVKAQSLNVYKAQQRGGRGKIATNVKDEDFIERLLIANTHDTILCFSSEGKAYWLKTYQLPQGGRASQGRPIVNLLPLDKDERITAILPVKDYSEDQFIFMVTEQGKVKKVTLQQFSRPRSNGIIAIDLQHGDHLIGVDITDGERDIMLFSDSGRVVRFNETDVRTIGRAGSGCRGMRLEAQERIIALQVTHSNEAILTATEKGYGKRTILEEYRRTSRGGRGVISIKVGERNGKVIGAKQVAENDHVMLITDKGTLVRTGVSNISQVGRNTKGVRLINLNSDEQLIGIQRIEENMIQANNIESS